MSYCSLIKGIIPKIGMLRFVLIKSVVLDLLCFCLFLLSWFSCWLFLFFLPLCLLLCFVVVFLVCAFFGGVGWGGGGWGEYNFVVSSLWLLWLTTPPHLPPPPSLPPPPPPTLFSRCIFISCFIAPIVHTIHAAR